MICLYDKPPCCVTINNEDYPIITDFREWIRFVDLAQTEELNVYEKVTVAMEWYKEDHPEDIATALTALVDFFQGKDDAEDTGEKAGNKASSQTPVFSYAHDAEVIYADFVRVYGIDLLDVDYIHWWKFKSLLFGLPGDSGFKTRVYYRSINLAEIQDDSERKRIRKLKERYALPASAITDEDIGNAFW